MWRRLRSDPWGPGGSGSGSLSCWQVPSGCGEGESMRVWAVRGVVPTLTVSEGRAGGGLGGHQAGCWWGQE